MSAELLSDLAIPMGVGVSGWVAASGKPLLNGNALTEFGVCGAVPPGFQLQTGLAIALDSESGPSGVLTLYSRERDAFFAPHLRVLLAIESSLAYYLRLEASGLTVSALEAVPPAGLPIGVQLELLSEQVRSESAYAPTGEPHTPSACESLPSLPRPGSTVESAARQAKNL
jgi:hypothetical protein